MAAPRITVDMMICGERGMNLVTIPIISLYKEIRKTGELNQ